MTALDPPHADVVRAVTRAFEEDLLADGDVTAAIVPAAATARFALRAREDGVLAGRACAVEAFRQMDPGLDVAWKCADGDMLAAGDTVMEVTGPLRAILTAERTVLNFLGHLSGVASLTRRFVTAAQAPNPSVHILDTRKTTPGLRSLEKAAVRAGGGQNHRSSLSEAILVKDNHLAGVSISEGVVRARTLWPGLPVQVECDSLEQVAEAAAAGVDALLLDNMTPEQVRVAVERARDVGGGRVLMEVSGRVNLETVAAYAASGVDRISIGALTHSAVVLDLGLDLIWRDTDRPSGKGD